MIFNIIVLCLSVIGLVNVIHYPIKGLKSLRPKVKELEGPVNIIDDVLLPDPTDPRWEHIPQNADPELNTSYWKLDNIKVWCHKPANIPMTTIKINYYFMADKDPNPKYEKYRNAIATAYAQHCTSKLLELE